ncbi:MAG: YncE family protein [Marmoricola sp.]
MPEVPVPRPTRGRLRGVLAFGLLVAVALAASGCGATARSAPAPASPSATSGHHAPDPSRSSAPLRWPFAHPLPGMPPVEGHDVYAADAAGTTQPRLAGDKAYLYVPNSYGAPTTTVIDQRTHKIVRVLTTGELSQHVTPSYDLRTLYVEASASNQLVALDPRTGRIERRILQTRPYNLYFTPDGRRAVVMAEQDDEIVFDDPHTFRRRAVVTDPSCKGPNHADFSANGRFFLVTCEFSDELLEVSTLHHRVIGHLHLPAGAKPQDVRLAPDGRTFWVAAMDHDELLQVDARHRLRVVHRIHTPSMPHGIYPSRDGRFLYVSDRGAGEVSVVSLAKRRIVDTWHAAGSHPDMGGISADGRTLWLSGRYDGYVYGWDTSSGKLVAKIRVGGDPHGLLVWPQPGRYSLGHTGNMR